jgi:hypothetical protein
MHKNIWGLIVGSFFAGIHLLWAILVLIGIAQPLLDFTCRLYFTNNPFTVGKFEILAAIELIVFTFALGYITGWLLALLCEKIHPKN